MAIKTYRKRPVEVQGVAYTGGNDGEVEQFTGRVNWRPATEKTAAFVWNDSQMAWNPVNAGDIVLRGLIGEFYPCSPAALAATYDEVET